jgi:tetratricopeptide (TPR) repeat protein
MLALWAGVGPAQAQVQQADAYGQAMARATKEEAQGHFAAAARHLEAVYADYPQDVDIAVRLGALSLRAGDFRRAERYYRDALALSPGDREARLGLGFALLRQSRCGAANEVFRGVLVQYPDDPGAAAGIHLCSVRPVLFTVGAALTGQFFPNAPLTRTDSLGPTVHLDSLILGRLALGATYRYRQFLTLYPVSNSSGTIEPFQGQHEVFLRAGYQSPRFGLGASYGVLLSQGIASTPSHHIGVHGRLSLLGDAMLDFSTSIYSDLIILRVFPSWRIPLPKGLSIKLGLAYQAVFTPPNPTPANTIDQTVPKGPPLMTGCPGMMCTTTVTMQTLKADVQEGPLLAGSLQLAWTGDRLGLFIGGKVGQELRPAYLDIPVIYDLPAIIKYGAWGGATLRLGRFSLIAAYAVDHLESQLGSVTSVTTRPPPPFPGAPMPPQKTTTTTSTPSTVTSFTHAMTLGGSINF